MERDKDYDNAFHYLEILLQVRGGGVPTVLAGRRCAGGAEGGAR